MKEQGKCDQCDYEGEFLRKHMKTNHTTKLAKTYNCKQCSFSATTVKVLKTHKEEVHGPAIKKIKCEDCDFIAEGSWVQRGKT